MNPVAYVASSLSTLPWEKVERYLGDRFSKVIVCSTDEGRIVQQLLDLFRHSHERYVVAHFIPGTPAFRAAEEALLILVMEEALDGAEVVPFVDMGRHLETFAQAVPALRRFAALSKADEMHS